MWNARLMVTQAPHIPLECVCLYFALHRVYIYTHWTLVRAQSDIISELVYAAYVCRWLDV